MNLAVRRILLFAACLATLAACAGRVLVEGRASLEASIEHRETDPRASVAHARRAASWYLPFAPHVDEAYRELRSLATSAEREGDRETAFLAWRAIRSASMSTRWIVEPRLRERREADAAIARLASEAALVSTMPNAPSPRDLERLHASALAREEAPNVGWVLVLLLGLVGWLGGMVWLVRAGLTREGRLVTHVATKAALLTIVGLGLFAVGLWMA